MCTYALAGLAYAFESYVSNVGTKRACVGVCVCVCARIHTATSPVEREILLPSLCHCLNNMQHKRDTWAIAFYLYTEFNRAASDRAQCTKQQFGFCVCARYKIQSVENMLSLLVTFAFPLLISDSLSLSPCRSVSPSLSLGPFHSRSLCFSSISLKIGRLITHKANMMCSVGIRWNSYRSTGQNI